MQTLYRNSFWKASSKSDTLAMQILKSGITAICVNILSQKQNDVKAKEMSELNGKVIRVMAKLFNNICAVPGARWRSNRHRKILTSNPSGAFFVCLFVCFKAHLPFSRSHHSIITFLAGKGQNFVAVHYSIKGLKSSVKVFERWFVIKVDYNLF